MKVALIFERFGEYHHARMAAAAEVCDLTGIEIAGMDRTYLWAKAEARRGYRFETLAEDMTTPRPEIAARLSVCLDRLRPAVIGVPGWAPHFAHAAMGWAIQHGARVVVMSDSNRYDAPRKAPQERIKRAILAHCSAGFVAGQDARTYITDLGMPEARVVPGYDVVDNAHFDSEADQARCGFLAVGRFIPRKNFMALLEVYNLYAERAAPEPWPLTLVGDGAERAALECKVQALGLSNHVRMPGFADYADLPALYAGAGAFVLPSLVEQWGLVVNEAMAAGLPVILSNRCGASRDLLVPGRNGFAIDPEDIAGMADALFAVAANPAKAAAMGQASREIIAGWAPECFARALKEVTALALSAPAPAPGAIDRLIFAALRRTLNR